MLTTSSLRTSTRRALCRMSASSTFLAQASSQLLQRQAFSTVNSPSEFLKSLQLDNLGELDLDHDPETFVLTVQLNREHRLNAMSFQMGQELHQLIDALSGAPPAGEVRSVSFGCAVVLASN